MFFTVACSHNRAWMYYAESVLNENAFPALPCSNSEAFHGGECNTTQERGVPAFMGFAANPGYGYCETKFEEKHYNFVTDIGGNSIWIPVTLPRMGEVSLESMKSLISFLLVSSIYFSKLLYTRLREIFVFLDVKLGPDEILLFSMFSKIFGDCFMACYKNKILEFVT